MADASVRAVHDALLALMPAGASHEDCPICPAARETAKEAGRVGEERTFTEAEHLALLTDRVARETAALTGERDQLSAAVTALQARVDVLDAEKAAALTERDNVRAELVAYRAEIAQQAAVAARRSDRVAQVRAANGALPDDYFTDERTGRWAEMADDQFAAFLSDLEGVAIPAAATKETAAFTGGESPTARPGASSLGAFLSARRAG